MGALSLHRIHYHFSLSLFSADDEARTTHRCLEDAGNQDRIGQVRCCLSILGKNSCC